MYSEGTIVALSTGSGGAIAIVRMSGSDAIAICDGVFRPRHGRESLCKTPGYTIRYGNITDGDRVIDEVLVSVFRAPHSYTGEDMVEISCHASSYIVREIILLMISRGARAASPGEFTVRAFMAGKLDLSQAEAVADMIASHDKASHTLAASQMRGGYSSELAVLRSRLLELVALLELELDFSEEEVAFADRGELRQLMTSLSDRMEELIESFAKGNVLKRGIPVAIVGKPNAGKSTLMNALLKQQRAMVSDIAGTTRDTIEECIAIGDVTFRFIDTAGVRPTSDPLEKMGIERTMASISEARVVIVVIDGMLFAGGDRSLREVIEDELRELPLTEGQRVCIVVNKTDRLQEVEPGALLFDGGHETVRMDAGGREIAAGTPGTTRYIRLSGPLCHEEEGTPEMSGSKPPADDYFHGGISLPDNDNFPVVDCVIAIAAKTGGGLYELKSRLSHCAESFAAYSGAAMVTNSRHYEALCSARGALDRALSASGYLSGDLLAQDLRESLHHLGVITGEITTDEILGSIFSKFCIGK